MRAPKHRTYDAVKRAMDVTLAGTALIALSPVMAATAGVVMASLGRPVIFRQERPGMNGKSFHLVKLRTMKPLLHDAQSDSERMTPVGNWLRATSLDELPTLWNVVKGDMSLVGPRPLLTWYVEHYTPHQARRHEVRPGVTGLAQVTGRNSVSWEERFDRDVEYVDRRSFRLDMEIIFRTIAVVLKRHGISHEGDATMPAFVDYRESDEFAHQGNQ